MFRSSLSSYLNGIGRFIQWHSEPSSPPENSKNWENPLNQILRGLDTAGIGVPKTKLQQYQLCRIYEGEILEGQSNGLGRYFFPEVQIIYTGYFRGSQLYGLGTVLTETNSISGIWNSTYPPVTKLINTKPDPSSSPANFPENVPSSEIESMHQIVMHLRIAHLAARLLRRDSRFVERIKYYKNSGDEHAQIRSLRPDEPVISY